MNFSLAVTGQQQPRYTAPPPPGEHALEVLRGGLKVAPDGIGMLQGKAATAAGV